MLENFSLLGGPLHRLGCCLGLVRRGTNTIMLGLALGVSVWAVLVVLALFEGIGDRVFSLAVIGGHVRLLVAIPLFFLCETGIDPRMTAFVRGIIHSGVVPKTALPALESEVARISRWRDSRWPEVICLLVSALMSFAPQLHLIGATATYDLRHVVDEPTLTAIWYWSVCLTLFRFLLLRWLWRLLLWFYFLWRVSRLKLNLVPIHPDGVAGLGSLEVVHIEFGTLVLAVAAVQAAAFAESIFAGTMTVAAIAPVLALMLVVEALIFIGPMCVFTPKLYVCRVAGLADYMGLAARYVNDFDRKWVREGAARREELLGTPDMQSLADLSTSVSVVSEMRLAPVSRRLLLSLAVPAFLPLLPLLLFEYPAADLAQKVFKGLFSL